MRGRAGIHRQPYRRRLSGEAIGDTGSYAAVTLDRDDGVDPVVDLFVDGGPADVAVTPSPYGEAVRVDRLAAVRHDAMAALLGIEAAAQGLTRHRDRLGAAQIDELAAGLVAEIGRLRALLATAVGGPEGADRPERRPPVPPDDPASADAGGLRDAVMPAVVCARANGQVVQVDVPDGLRVAGPRGTVTRVLVSLLSNAGRHAPGSPVDVWATGDGAHVVLRVDDRGSGVPIAARARLFEPGVRSRTTGGSGLGLAIVRLLVSELGGAVWYEPRAGGGSSFVVRLPAARPEAGASAGPVTAGAPTLTAGRAAAGPPAARAAR